MPAFKGNVGNLMQHWVLCELLSVARKLGTSLTFIDAHAMAPAPRRRTGKCRRFDAVQKLLPEGQSVYERVWAKLQERGKERRGQAYAARESSPPETYPNSARFVKCVWSAHGPLSMLLCERDEPTVCLLRSWAGAQAGIDIEIAQGDWRKRFKCGLPEQRGIVFISFDPYMFNRNDCKSKKPGNMYPCDLDLLVEATHGYSENVLLQLSTYSANGGNRQCDVAACIRSKLQPAGFEEAAAVKANGNMMSLVYGRGAAFAGELASLPRRFREWLPPSGGRT